MEKVFEIYIRTTPERLWEAITDPEIRAKYNFGARRRQSDWKPGSRYRDEFPERPTRLLGEGEILEVDPPRRLVQTMCALWSDDVKSEGYVAGHLGDRAGRATPAGSRSPTTSCARARTTSSTAAGR